MTDALLAQCRAIAGDAHDCGVAGDGVAHLQPFAKEDDGVNPAGLGQPPP